MLVDPSDKDEHEEGDNDYGEDEEPEEDEEEDGYVTEQDGRNPHQLIIINEHQFLGEDDKKVVYLSNINSCSLPQTPKLDDQQPPPANVSNLLEKS